MLGIRGRSRRCCRCSGSARLRHSHLARSGARPSSSGTSLLSDDAVARLKDRLLPLTNLLTPIFPKRSICPASLLEAATTCSVRRTPCARMGADAVLIKGGHAPGTPVRDFLSARPAIEEFETHDPTRSTHGNRMHARVRDCLRTRTAAPADEAVRSARAFVQAALETAPIWAEAQGPLNHLHDNPRPSDVDGVNASSDDGHRSKPASNDFFRLAHDA